MHLTGLDLMAHATPNWRLCFPKVSNCDTPQPGRQTRLTALDLIAYAAADERPQQFVHCSEEELAAAVASVSVRASNQLCTLKGFEMKFLKARAGNGSQSMCLCIRKHLHLGIAPLSSPSTPHTNTHRIPACGTRYSLGWACTTRA